LLKENTHRRDHATVPVAVANMKEEKSWNLNYKGYKND